MPINWILGHKPQHYELKKKNNNVIDGCKEIGYDFF